MGGGAGSWGAEIPDIANSHRRRDVVDSPSFGIPGGPMGSYVRRAIADVLISDISGFRGPAGAIRFSAWRRVVLIILKYQFPRGACRRNPDVTVFTIPESGDIRCFRIFTMVGACRPTKKS